MFSSNTSLFRPLIILFYKNVRFRRRYWFYTLIEILVPISLFYAVVYSKHSYPLIFGRSVRRDAFVYPLLNEQLVFSKLVLSDQLDLFYTPATPLASDLMADVSAVISARSMRNVSINVVPVKSETEMESMFYKLLQSRDEANASLPAPDGYGIVFQTFPEDPNNNTLPADFKYKIRPASKDFNTEKLMSYSHIPLGDLTIKSVYSNVKSPEKSIGGIIKSINTILNSQEAFIEIQDGGKISRNLNVCTVIIQGLPTLTTSLQFFIALLPSPAYHDDIVAYPVLKFFLPAVAIAGYMILVPLSIKNIVLEKETGGKELMRRMGYQNWMIWFGWLSNNLVPFSISAVISSILLITDVHGEGSLFQTIDVSLLFTLFLLNCLVITCFSFALSPIFSKCENQISRYPVNAMFWGIFLWILSCGLPEMVYRRSPYKNLINFVHRFLPNAMVNKGWESMVYLEEKGYAVHWSNIFVQPTDGKTPSLFTVFCILLLHSFVLFLVAWYLDAVHPGPYGIAKPYNFFLKRSYWCCCSDSSTNYDNNASKSAFNDNFEPVSDELTVGVHLNKLHKKFAGLTAVENLSIDFYKGQITVLLGHNGAGKTTTMSMLTGMLTPTSGEVIVNGQNVFENIQLFRENLGLCPQQNLFFSYLSVLEHLIFFGMIKNMSKSEAAAQGLRLLELLQIDHKKDARPTHLSGGMKRKLSLAIAMMGSPKILMLDEPTSGMDPESRREMWDLLLSLRGDRTILITTHHMEEAEALGDRIAIMSRGSVKCYGSLMFLKRLFGACFYLKIIKESNSPNKRESVTAIISESIPEAVLHENHTQFVFTLPIDSVQKFPSILTTLESKQEALGILNISVLWPSLEEIFLKVGAENINSSSDIKDTDNSFLSLNGVSQWKDFPERKLNGYELFVQQFKALLVKKWKFTRRKIFFYLLFGALPIIVGFGACKNMNAFIAAQIDVYVPPELPLTAKIYSGFLHYRSDSGSSHLDPVFESVAEPPIKLKRIPDAEVTSSYLMKLGEEDLFKYYKESVGAVEFQNNSLNVYYNHHLTHSLPILLNLVYNTLAKANSDKIKITTSIQPIISSDLFRIAFEEQKRILGLIFMWVILFASSIMTFNGCFILFPQTERVNKFKRLQMMTGVPPMMYWTASFAIDFLYASVVLALSLLCINTFDQYRILSNSPEFEILSVVVFLYGFVGVIFAYFCSNFQRRFAATFFTYVITNIVLGSICACVVFNFQELDFFFQTESTHLDILHYMLLLLPHYSLSMLLFNYIVLAWNNKCRFHLVQSEELCVVKDYWEFRDQKVEYGVNAGSLALILDAVFYIGLIVCSEKLIFKKLYHLWTLFIRGADISDSEMGLEDMDVLSEKNYVAQSKAQNDSNSSVFIVDNLQKKFTKNFAAVRGVNFVVKSGECFGLLGVNGAGKTTTFRILTGDLFPTKGDCLLLKNKLSSSRNEYFSRIGYCPQYDALNEVLTGEETLTLFASLRGIQPARIQEEVNQWIHELGLDLYKQRTCGNYSGGTKRKLSTAVALIGRPSLVVLDEPTSGVDPISRRNLWHTLKKCCQMGQSIIVTSHSMDECEEICDRLTIMVSGKMKCIGSIPHLKKKFGQGYTVMIKLKPSQFGKVEVEELKEKMRSLFPSILVLKYEHLSMLHYHITDSGIQLSYLFGKLLDIQNKFYVVEDFTISQTTLEQVFLAFAKDRASI